MPRFRNLPFPTPPLQSSLSGPQAPLHPPHDHGHVHGHAHAHGHGHDRGCGHQDGDDAPLRFPELLKADIP